jgi:hypothetical protein
MQADENLWKQQEEEPMNLTVEDVCARGRRHQRNDARVGWVLLALTPLVIAAYIRNLLQFHDRWLIAGTGWGLAAFCYFVWISIRNGTRPKPAEEPCVHYLRRLFEGKRRWASQMRWAVLMCIPAIVAVRVGRGTALNARSLAVTAPWLLLLALVWFAMTLEARRLEREIQNLGSQ